jgi:hypothetical protein
VCPTGPAGPAVRSPERALYASPGQRPGYQDTPPSQHPERVQQPHLTHRPSRAGGQLAGFVRQRMRVRSRGGLLSGALKGRCPGLVCIALSGQVGNGMQCVTGRRVCASEDGLTCGLLVVVVSGRGATVVVLDRSAPSPAAERTGCPRHIGALPADRGSTTTTTTARRVGRLTDHDNGRSNAGPCQEIWLDKLES